MARAGTRVGGGRGRGGLVRIERHAAAEGVLLFFDDAGGFVVEGVDLLLRQSEARDEDRDFAAEAGDLKGVLAERGGAA